ncbi:MAG: serine protease [Planctomycetota bacterium]
MALAVFLTHAPATRASSATQPPHPAVARIIVAEGDGSAFGTGTLIDARGEFGLVVTNWHVVRHATGPIRVVFPSGFQSEARRLKLDEDWDLAALVIWRPPAAPVPLATQAPKPGDPLTICGYGQGTYREATGRCTAYYAPDLNLPREIVELDVEARQGDSGGPILNAHGELAGVLFGAGQGATLGSFGGRVQEFLASLRPDQPRTSPPSMAMPPAAPSFEPAPEQQLADAGEQDPLQREEPAAFALASTVIDARPAVDDEAEAGVVADDAKGDIQATVNAAPSFATPFDWFETAKTALAAFGLAVIGLQLVRWLI